MKLDTTHGNSSLSVEVVQSRQSKPLHALGSIPPSPLRTSSPTMSTSASGSENGALRARAVLAKISPMLAQCVLEAEQHAEARGGACGESVDGLEELLGDANVLLGDTVIVPRLDMTSATQRRLDNCMERHCRVVYDRDFVVVPTALVVLPYELQWDPETKGLYAPSPDHMPLATEIGKCLLDINKATARLSFWLMLKRHLAENDGGRFKSQLKDWLCRAREEPPELVAIEIVTEIGCGAQYIDLCREMLERTDKISNARAYIRDPMNAAMEAIAQSTETFLRCYCSGTHYFYLVDEFIGAPSLPAGSTKVTKRDNLPADLYPLPLHPAEELLRDVFLPFMNMTMMAAAASDGLAAVARLLGMPPSSEYPRSWTGAEPGLIHSLRQPSSVAEFAVLQGMVKRHQVIQERRLAEQLRQKDEEWTRRRERERFRQRELQVEKEALTTRPPLHPNQLHHFARQNHQVNNQRLERAGSRRIQPPRRDRDDHTDSESSGSYSEESRSTSCSSSSYTGTGSVTSSMESSYRSRSVMEMSELDRLEMFFREFDPMKMYAELARVSDGKGSALWTGQEVLELIQEEAELARTEYRLRELKKEWSRRERIGEEIAVLSDKLKKLKPVHPSSSRSLRSSRLEDYAESVHNEQRDFHHRRMMESIAGEESFGVHGSIYINSDYDLGQDFETNRSYSSRHSKRDASTELEDASNSKDVTPKMNSTRSIETWPAAKQQRPRATQRNSPTRCSSVSEFPSEDETESTENSMNESIGGGDAGGGQPFQWNASPKNKQKTMKESVASDSLVNSSNSVGRCPMTIDNKLGAYAKEAASKTLSRMGSSKRSMRSCDDSRLYSPLDSGSTSTRHYNRALEAYLQEDMSESQEPLTLSSTTSSVDSIGLKNDDSTNDHNADEAGGASARTPVPPQTVERTCDARSRDCEDLSQLKTIISSKGKKVINKTRHYINMCNAKNEEQ